MTERPNYTPDRRNDEPNSTLDRMRSMLVEASRAGDADEDVLLQYMGLFNHMLRVDEVDAEPVYVVFAVSPDVNKNDQLGRPIKELPVESGEYRTRFGEVSRCVVVQEASESATQSLFMYVNLLPGDRDDFAFGGAYSIELARLDGRLIVNDFQVDEVALPVLDPEDDFSGLSKAEQQLAGHMEDYAELIDDWERVHLSDSDEPAPISTLLGLIADQANSLPLNNKDHYVDLQMTVFNLMINDARDGNYLLARGSGVAADKQVGRPNNLDTNGRYRGKYEDDIRLTAKALDVAFDDGKLSGYLYGVDGKGAIRRLYIDQHSEDVSLERGAFESETEN